MTTSTSLFPSGPSVEGSRASVLTGANDDFAKNYVVVTSASGAGFSALGNTALTTWEGPGDSGFQLHLRDLDEGLSWTPGRATGPTAQPSRTAGKSGIFLLQQEVGGVEATLETCVLNDVPAELRRITLRDTSGRRRNLDVTSAAEIVLDSRGAFAAHPAFSKLFIQTRWDEATRCLMVNRRPRSPEEQHPVLFHALLEDGPLQMETDRARFLGRGQAPGRVAALDSSAPLTGTLGNVLDPMVSLRRPVHLEPGGSATLTFLFGAHEDPGLAQRLTAALRAPGGVEQAFARVAKAAARRLNAHSLGEEEVAAAGEMAAAVLMGMPGLRRPPASRPQHPLDPGGLAQLGLDPALPLVLVDADAGTTADLVKRHDIWLAMNLPIQLVILNGEAAPEGGPSRHRHQPAEDQLTEQLRHLLRARADAVVESAVDLEIAPALPERLSPPRPMLGEPARRQPAEMADDAEFAGDWGAFTDQGRQYTLNLVARENGLNLPPRPWTNVLANENFGCLISETGATCTWFGNSREHRLTPWFNDPVRDPHGEALWVRDQEGGAVFSCHAGPEPAGADYEVTHGQGFTRTRRHGPEGLDVETLVCVDIQDPVRLARVRLTNSGQVARRLTLFSYQQMVLGGTPAADDRYIQVERPQQGSGLLAASDLAGPFAGAVAFATLGSNDNGGDMGCGDMGFSADGQAFRPDGPAGKLQPPAAGKLDDRIADSVAPCLALSRSLGLAPGETAEVWAVLGMETTRERAQEALQRYTDADACAAALERTLATWRRILDAVQVSTPVRELDVMVNGWLAYQTLACRLMGRTAFYQSGGAFGFRDQLQDSLSLLPVLPGLVRRQILLNAGHQFVEGDVLHWWHPPLDRGIRTRFADDLLWLPLAVVEYLEATGDGSILEEEAPYLAATSLEPGQDEVFLQAEPSGEAGSVFDHCCRALDRSLTVGRHGLPLFGTGDWNDGMNRVGRLGQGESVWMGFFLVKILDGFIPLCRTRGEAKRAHRYQSFRDDMIHALNDEGWDGGWYRRGYYDSGEPLGSWENKECAIDALAQAWSVLSGAAPRQRGLQAMSAVDKHLIDRDNKIIRLLTPPFVDTPRDPGYIKGYVAGVRENGGQYTHAALWVVRALAALGQRNKAADLLTMLTPVAHTAHREGALRYQVEPYVVAADVYGAAPHVGRGGWTWYTGSSGWMHRVALESILGLRSEGDTLVVAPCLPDSWPEFSLRWRVPDPRADFPGTGSDAPMTTYTIRVSNPERCAATVVDVICDGVESPPVDGQAHLHLLRDGRHHEVQITLGPEDTP